MIDPMLSLAHSAYASQGCFALLLGSGISSASGIPTGWQVTLDLARRLAALENTKPGADIEAWYVAHYKKAPSYSELLDALAKTPAERRRLLHGYFEPTPAEREQGLKLPSAAHRAIARLVAAGYVKVILTTNFDRLMETALRDEGIEPTVISTPDAAEGAAPLIHQRCVVVKLHGDYLDDRIKNTDDELAVFDPRMNAYLDRVLDEFGLILCGWSREWDAALRAGIERCRSFRYTTYWATNAALGSRGATLAALRRAQVVAIKDADSFFTSLEDKIASLAEIQAHDPLSVPTAVASLKRYIVEDRHRIRLHDLVSNEVASLRDSLLAMLEVNKPVPDQGSFKQRIARYDAATEVLRNLLFHGGRWARAEHHDVLLNVFQMIVPRSTTGGYTVWIDLQAYPIAQLVYALGLGALGSRNYVLLRKLFGVEFVHQGKPRSVLRSLSYAVGQAGDLPNALHGTGRYTPMSDHLAALLEPMTASVSGAPDVLFDQLEVMIALAVLDSADAVPDGPTWLPWGRFAWKGGHDDNSPTAALFADAASAGKEWGPLKAGMFRGQLERFTAVRNAFEASMADVAGRFW